MRWNAGLRNRKGTVYEGGIRVPCYVRWPKEAKAGAVGRARRWRTSTSRRPFFDACEVPIRTPRSTAASFRAADSAGRIPRGPNRALFFQWHRGDEPEKFRAFAARGPEYKLVQATGVPQGAKWQPKYELFDITTDPFEEKDLAADKPEEVAQLKKEYEAWFADVTKKGFAPPRIVIGSEKENPVRLSRQDWRGPKAGWAPESEGHWEVRVERAGRYEVTIRSRTEFTRCEASVDYGSSTGSARDSDRREKEVPAFEADMQTYRPGCRRRRIEARSSTW